MQRASQLTNLLPPERIGAQRRRYFMRLLTVLVLLVAGTVTASAALLAPSYLLAREQVAQKQARLTNLSANLSGAEEQAITARVKELTANATRLTRLAGQPTGSNVIAALVRVSRPGIRLTGFTYTPPAADVPARMLVTGIAADRDSLRRYVSALAALPYVASADLPISAYAKEADIDFSITLSGPLNPATP